MKAIPGDVFLGLDFALDTVAIHRRQLARFKRTGGKLWFVMYDLLPVQRPDWFAETVSIRFSRWLRTIAALADGFYCISAGVQADLRNELMCRYQLTSGFETPVLPMGWDVTGSRPTSGIPADFNALLAAVASNRTAMMVGTLEPRKGHADILAAFDLLWSEGHLHNLVVVGRKGWKTEALQNDLRTHALAGKHVLITAGRRDPIGPAPLTEKLAAYFSAQGAATSIHWHEGGHELRQDELTAARSLLT